MKHIPHVFIHSDWQSAGGRHDLSYSIREQDAGKWNKLVAGDVWDTLGIGCNVSRFVDSIFNVIFLHENYCISIHVSPTFVSNGQFKNGVAFYRQHLGAVRRPIHCLNQWWPNKTCVSHSVSIDWLITYIKLATPSLPFCVIAFLAQFY